MVEHTVEVWSDIACPWCYVGKRHLEAALAEFAGSVTVRWRSFELDPSAPAEIDGSVPYVERLARKYRVPASQAQQMIDRMVEVGTKVPGEPIEFRFDRIRPGNTFDGHRLLHWAQKKGVQGELKERLLHDYMTDGVLISDHEALVTAAEAVGLSADRATAVLSSDEFAPEVRADQQRARELEIHGVPFFLFDARMGVGGAQPPATLLRGLQRAFPHETEPGEACGVDGC